MTDKYTALRAAISAGPSKEWSAGIIHPRANVRRRTPDGGWGCGPHCAKTDQAYHDSAYIAAASPEVIAALLAERDALREALKLFVQHEREMEADEAVSAMLTYAQLKDAATSALAMGEGNE